MSQLKIKDGNDWISVTANGNGVPAGGSAGQFLAKSSSTDYATEWSNLPDYSVHYEDLTIGTVAATTAGTKSYTFVDTRPKNAVWVCDVSGGDRVGLIYQVRNDYTDTSIDIWYYNARSAAAANCVVRIFYTLA